MTTFPSLQNLKGILKNTYTETIYGIELAATSNFQHWMPVNRFSRDYSILTGKGNFLRHHTACGSLWDIIFINSFDLHLFVFLMIAFSKEFYWTVIEAMSILSFETPRTSWKNTHKEADITIIVCWCIYISL